MELDPSSDEVLFLDQTLESFFVLPYEESIVLEV